MATENLAFSFEDLSITSVFELQAYVSYLSTAYPGLLPNRTVTNIMIFL